MVYAIAGIASVYVLAVIALGLEFRPVKPRLVDERDRFVEVLGSRIAYRVQESVGPTLILLHGFGGSLLAWEGLLPKLTCGRVITVDLLGFGASSQPNADYDLETHRRHLVGVMDALGIPKAVLVGGSFGASLTLWTAAQSPDRVVAAIAMAPSGMPGELHSPWPRSFLFRPGLPNSAAMALARSPLFGGLFANSQARQGLGISGSYGPEFEAAMSKVRAPVMLFWSPGDPTAPYSYRDRYLRAIPHAKLITFAERSGHNIAGAEPDRAAQHICEFVAELPKTGADPETGLGADPKTGHGADPKVTAVEK